MRAIHSLAAETRASSTFGRLSKLVNRSRQEIGAARRAVDFAIECSGRLLARTSFRPVMQAIKHDAVSSGPEKARAHDRHQEGANAEGDSLHGFQTRVG